MNANEFIQRFSVLNINDTYIKNPEAINTKQVPNELHIYLLDSHYYYDENLISILWVTEQWNNHINMIVNEINRYYKYLANKYQLEEDIEVEITIGNKIGEYNKYFKIVIYKYGGK